MRANILTITALAAGASAWTYPDCEADNCYRALGAEKNKEVAEPFCLAYLKAPVDVPAAFGNCKGDEKRISSACSCVTYTATHTPTSSASSVSSVSSTKTTLATTTPASSSTTAHSSSTTKMTTSTITTTSIITVTTCPPSKPCHPVETQVITTYTTVCPVETTPPAPTTKSEPSAPPPAPTTTPAPPKPTGTGSPNPPKPSSSSTQVTAGAARFTQAAQLALAAAGVAALF